MQTAARNNLILTGCPSYAGSSSSQSLASRNGLFLQLVLNKYSYSIHPRQDFQNIAYKLIRVAEHAYSLRDMDTVGEAGSILMNLPLEYSGQIGQYYRSLYLKRSGQIDKAQHLLEALVNEANTTYKARAIQTLGTICHEQGKLDDALKLYLEAARITSFNGPELLPMFMAHLQLSFIRSDSGDHKGALAHLENLLPVLNLATRYIPFYFYVYYADLAYELAHVGRLDEAEAAVSIALNSPFAPAYPEWLETRDEIAAKRQAAACSHSQVAINSSSQQKPSRQPDRKLSIAFAFSFHICKADYLRPPEQITASASEYSGCLTRLILKRIHRCIRPRSPPALS
jgi:tetratricopeptide (TPR) repeat protein